MSLSLILSLLSGIMPLFQKYIGTGLDGLIQTGLQALQQLIATWVKGSPVAHIKASLNALQTVLTGLENDPATDSADLPQIAEVGKIIQAGIQGYEDAANGEDPGTLPIPPAVS